MLSRFKVIVACDLKHGIAKNNKIPWSLSKDRKFFATKTIGKGQVSSSGHTTSHSSHTHFSNAVIMGKETYLALPDSQRPLPQRKNIVISTTLSQLEHPDILIYTSLLSALIDLPRHKFEDVYICGGERLYTESLTTFLYLCDKVYVSKVDGDFHCDRHFPFNLMDTNPSKIKETHSGSPGFTVFSYSPHNQHPEESFLGLLKSCIQKGEEKDDRTHVGTFSIFGEKLEFNIRDTIPAITTKQLPLKTIVKELLWMISGSTDARQLEQQGVRIWSENSSRAFLDSRGLTQLEVGDIGSGYGFQWRHWGADYTSCTADYTGQGVDQLQQVISEIKHNSCSRRLIVSAWNVSQLKTMALPPCHMQFQFNVSGTNLDCMVTQRSADLFLGLPFNLVFYSVLTHIVAHLCHLNPRRLIFSLGDCHVYKNHLEQVAEQLSRTPRPWPRLVLKDVEGVKDISDFKLEHISFEGYSSWDKIVAPMAV